MSKEIREIPRLKAELSKFLNWVEDETYFFEDKDVTVEQIVDAYLALDSDSKQ
jgi:hypothetical protein